MPEVVIGISAYYHDSAVALLEDGKIIAAAHEERFSRKKHDAGFPTNALQYVLHESGLDPENVVAVAFYDKPYLKFERLLETYHAFAPKGLISFLSAIPVWIKEKMFLKRQLRKELNKHGINNSIPLLFPEHHLSHAASAFFPSPFKKSAILTIDGVGEWTTTSIAVGEKNKIKVLEELHFPHSIGLLYSAFTYFLGFRVNSGEYKLMGLAPYGIPNSERVEKFKAIIKEKLVDIRKDGSILLNMRYFSFATGLRMVDDKKWKNLFGMPKRESESELTQPYMDLALAIQQVTENVVMLLAKTTREITGCENLVMAGGVALNSVANGKILKSNIFKSIWIQPAAGDAGGALGAALAAWYIWNGKERNTISPVDEMNGSQLGPSYTNNEIYKAIRKTGVSAEFHDDFDKLASMVAEYLEQSKVVGWFQGRMEFGPRALGNRSILGNPMDPEMQKRLNLKIKYREGFRPFAPSVLEEDVSTIFDLNEASPYMLFIVPVLETLSKKLPDNYNNLSLYDRLYTLRSELPAITHIDFSARLQTVRKQTNPKYWKLINEFKKLTGYGTIINTSFNVRGEPIVCTPEDAIKCFLSTEMDYLVLENYILAKSDQKDFDVSRLENKKFFLD